MEHEILHSHFEVYNTHNIIIVGYFFKELSFINILCYTFLLNKSPNAHFNYIFREKCLFLPNSLKKEMH